MSRESIEIYRALKDEGAKYWVAVVVSPLLALFALGMSRGSTWGIIVSLCYFAVFFQSIRGIRYTSKLKKKLQASPSLVSKSDILNGPIIMGIPGLHWFVSLTR